jgi:hypothetical protein
MSLLLSTARIWSSAISPDIHKKELFTLTGIGVVLLVNGTTITVKQYKLTSSLLITKQGLVFCISPHFVGSRLTNQISKRWITLAMFVRGYQNKKGMREIPHLP